MRAVLVAVLLSTTVAAAGCGGSGVAQVSAPAWVQRANTACKRDDRAFRNASFDSAATFMGLRREVRDLGQLGFFRHVPAVEADLAAAGRLWGRVGAGDFRAMRKADEALIRARRDAARSGVHCSFAAYPLQNL